VLEGTIRLGGQEHFYLEPNGCIVLPTEDDEYTLISSTQAPTKHQVKLQFLCRFSSYVLMFQQVFAFISSTQAPTKHQVRLQFGALNCYVAECSACTAGVWPANRR
jgi:hypothetical protein